MKKMHVAFLVSLILPAYLFSGIQAVHMVVLCPGGRPDVVSYFEQSEETSTQPEQCRFLDLTSDTSPQARSAWNASIQAFQTLTLTAQSSVSTSDGTQENYLDGQGRVRRILRTSSQGLVTESALFDANGHILRLDRWRNQTVVPDAQLKPLVCGPSTEHALNIRVFSSASGNIPLEVGELEFVADTVTNDVLVHALGLTTTACSDNTLAAGNGPTSALAQASVSSPSSIPKATATPSGILGQVLAAAPNPATGRVLIFYRLPGHFADVRILIYNLTGRESRSYVQGDQDAGSYQLSADLGGLSRGVYFVFLVGNNGESSTVISRFKLAVLN